MMKNFYLFSFACLLSFLFLPLSSINAGVYTMPDPLDPLSSFLITVETTDEGVLLKCKEGCGWLELTYSSYEIINGEKVWEKAVVDQNGVSGCIQGIGPNKYTEANFLFTIQKTKEGVALEGLKGMAWKSLSFNCNVFCPQDIDEMGMKGK